MNMPLCKKRLAWQWLAVAADAAARPGCPGKSKGLSLNNYLKKLHPILMENMYARFKHNFRSSKTGRFLKPGDEVFAYKPDLKAGKLACNYFGPLTVTRQCHDNTYEVRCCRTGKIYRRNLRHLRRLTSRDEVKIGSEANLQKSEKHESTISNYVPNELDFINTIRSWCVFSKL